MSFYLIIIYINTLKIVLESDRKFNLIVIKVPLKKIGSMRIINSLQ